MNNYVVAKNAVIATALVMLLTISLQPQKLSNTILGWTDTATDLFTRKSISAAEKIEENGNAALLTNENGHKIAITKEDKVDNIEQKAIKLASELTDEFTDIRVQPVMRGKYLYYEVSSEIEAHNGRIVNYSIINTDSNTIVISPDPDIDQSELNKLLSDLKH